MSDGYSFNKYGIVRLNYLKESKPAVYSSMQLSGELSSHLQEIGDLAAERVRSLTGALAEKTKMPDKATDIQGWTATMNALKHQAEEVVLNDLICV